MASKRMSAEAGVRAASERFYDALERMANGEAGSISETWSHSDDVTAMHPVGGREEGWDAVRGSFEGFAGIAEDGEISTSDQVVRVFGETAYELVTEHVSLTLGGHPVEAEHRATNVYRREEGDWKMVHHHTDLSSEFVEILQGMESGE